MLPTFTPDLIIKNSNSDSWFRGIHSVELNRLSGNIWSPFGIGCHMAKRVNTQTVIIITITYEKHYYLADALCMSVHLFIPVLTCNIFTDVCCFMNHELWWFISNLQLKWILIYFGLVSSAHCFLFMTTVVLQYSYQGIHCAPIFSCV